MTGFGAALLVLAGPAVGSFAAVLADRLPRGEDAVLRRSACRSCGAPIAARDLVPLLSWLALRGRCRACGAAIPAALPLAEIGGAGAAVLAVIGTDGGAHMAAAAVWLWLLLALALADAQWFRLPDLLTGALALAGLALAWADPGRGLTGAALSGLGAVAAFWAIRAAYRGLRRREGLGLGDVKLMAGIGAGLGALQIPTAVLAASGLALLVTLAAAALGRGGAVTGTRAVPFGSYLCLGAAVAWALAAGGLV